MSTRGFGVRDVFLSRFRVMFFSGVLFLSVGVQNNLSAFRVMSILLLVTIVEEKLLLRTFLGLGGLF